MIIEWKKISKWIRIQPMRRRESAALESRLRLDVITWPKNDLLFSLRGIEAVTRLLFFRAGGL